MPLFTERVSGLLNDKAAAFRRLDHNVKTEVLSLRAGLANVEDMECSDIEAAVSGTARPGALPTHEHNEHRIVRPFPAHWDNHEQARQWAAQALRGIPTFAADGSQIAPSRDLSLPVGLIQIGWFLNPHSPALPYEKDVSLELLTPEDLQNGEMMLGDQEVGWRRFRGEVERIKVFLDRYKGEKAVAFFDGSLIVSFVQMLHPKHQRLYVELLNSLLAKSEATRVPVIGFVDTSYANDLVMLVSRITNFTSGSRVSDASLLSDLMNWGDRSSLFTCYRDDGVLDNDFYEQICFTYLKTTRDNPPARVEIPRWLIEQADTYEWVIDVVRGEVIVGLGYPYVIETADAVAVLSMEDRERFYKIFQQFADKEELPLRFSRKSISKRVRRR